MSILHQSTDSKDKSVNENGLLITQHFSYMSINFRQIVLIVLINETRSSVNVFGNSLIGPPLSHIPIFIKHSTYKKYLFKFLTLKYFSNLFTYHCRQTHALVHDPKSFRLIHNLVPCARKKKILKF